MRVAAPIWLTLLLFWAETAGAQKEMPLPPWIQDYLQKQYPEWRLDRTTASYSKEFWAIYVDCHPNVISGDFNDDQVPDFGVLLERGTPEAFTRDSLLLILLGNLEGTFVPVPDKGGSGAHLCLIKKGQSSLEIGDEGTRTIINPSDGLALVYEGRFGYCIFVSGYQVRRVLCGD